MFLNENGGGGGCAASGDFYFAFSLWLLCKSLCLTDARYCCNDHNLTNEVMVLTKKFFFKDLITLDLGFVGALETGRNQWNYTVTTITG